jgi:hypothetical protein
MKRDEKCATARKLWDVLVKEAQEQGRIRRIQYTAQQRRRFMLTVGGLIAAALILTVIRSWIR